MSLTLTDEQFLRGDKDAGVPAELSAVLQLPGGVPGPLPAVVLLHGSGGYGSGSVDSWADIFRDARDCPDLRRGAAHCPF